MHSFSCYQLWEPLNYMRANGMTPSIDLLRT